MASLRDSSPASASPQQEDRTAQVDMSFFETGKTDEEILRGDHRDIADDGILQLSATRSLDDIVQVLDDLHLSHHSGTVTQRSSMGFRFTRSLVNVSKKRGMSENALQDVLMAIQEANDLRPCNDWKAIKGKHRTMEAARTLFEFSSRVVKFEES